MAHFIREVLSAYGPDAELTLYELRDRIARNTGHRPQVARLIATLHAAGVPSETRPGNVYAGVPGPPRVVYLKRDVQNAVDDLPAGEALDSPRPPRVSRVTCQLRLPSALVARCERLAEAQGARLSDVVAKILDQQVPA